MMHRKVGTRSRAQTETSLGAFGHSYRITHDDHCGEFEDCSEQLPGSSVVGSRLIYYRSAKTALVAISAVLIGPVRLHPE
jgi:hypothetical protein